jgi:hypothetical protein
MPEKIFFYLLNKSCFGHDLLDAFYQVAKNVVTRAMFSRFAADTFLLNL